MPTRTLAPILLVLHLATPAESQDYGTPPPVTVVHCGHLLAVPGEAPLEKQTLVIRGDRIDGIKAGFVSLAEAGAGEGARLVDLSDAWVLPGLIDCHTHVTGAYDHEARLRAVQESDADAAVRGAAYARRTLLAGFTTIRDVGNSGDSAFAVRDGIAAGLIPGPRVLVAGESITPTGGHSDGTLGYREELFAMPAAMEGIADGPDACRKAVRAQVKRGADVIKLTATGGVLSNTASGYEQQFFEDELAAIVTTAHLLGRRVAAHAHGRNGIKAALRAGVDSIEHGTFLDDEAVELFVQSGAFLVPTLMAGETVARHAGTPGYYTKAVAAKAREVGPAMNAAFGKAVAGGVRVAFGTDSGVSPHGENAREFELMVAGGMTPAAAIVAATRNAAELCGLAADLGTLEPGKLADVVATRKDPTRDVSELRRIRFVMRGGAVHRDDR
jgi:imidazolonepropionase-like amidohydrolase